MSSRLIDDGLFAEDAGAPALAGSRCADCGTTTFPRQPGCPRCGAPAMTDVELPRTGVIWSATVQHFAPKPPFRHDGGETGFVPFGVGYVDLGEVIVETRFTQARADRLGIGQPVTLTTVPAFTDDDGTVVLTYAFDPDDPVDLVDPSAEQERAG